MNPGDRMNLVNRLNVGLLFCLLPIAWGGDAQAQDKGNVAAANLAAAQEISAASGRPIFAIAGRNT